MSAHQEDLPAWPYPAWIAHRGAGKLAPENTLAAMRHGAALGYRMFECDVKLSADGVPFLLHDATLPRTTNARSRIGSGQSAVAGDHPWAVLSQLDAGSWHSPRWTGEPVPTLEAIARWCLANALYLNIEIKPTPGAEAQTGAVVAQAAAAYWVDADVKPLLTSFSVEALSAAQAAASDVPRGLLLDSLWGGWLETALVVGCHAVVAHHVLWDASSVLQARSAGLRCLSYTVNDDWAAQRLMALGTDGIITDRVDFFVPRPGPLLPQSPQHRLSDGG